MLLGHMETTVKMAAELASRWPSVFITGCNRGIGLEMVRQFLKLPVPPKCVFATCRSLASDGAADLVALSKVSPNLKLLELDVRSAEGISRVYSEVEQDLRDEGLFLLINNAGVLPKSRFEEVTAEEMIDTFKTNTLAPLMIAQEFLPLLRRAAAKTKTGDAANVAIVNVSSGAGRLGKDFKPGEPVGYKTSKAALNMASKVMSVDLATDGIVCVSVTPGLVKTDMGVGWTTLPCNEKSSNPVFLSPEESVKGLMEVMGKLDPSMSGRFYDLHGNVYAS